jgi:hypothetical protein
MAAHKHMDWAVDWAVRLENSSGASKGKTARAGGAGRWLLLPAAGAGLYALATSRAFSRQAKDVMDQAKTLPDDLIGRLRQTTQKPTERETTRSSTGNGGRERRPQTKARKSGTRRKTAQSR